MIDFGFSSFDTLKNKQEVISKGKKEKKGKAEKLEGVVFDAADKLMQIG